MNRAQMIAKDIRQAADEDSAALIVEEIVDDAERTKGLGTLITGVLYGAALTLLAVWVWP